MDSQQLTRLRHEQEHALFETDSKIQKWEKFKSDYVALKERLKTLPDKITHDVMVPFGSMAFMPGKLVHTNEILVLLGDNWFVDRSAKQAAAIVARRIKAVEAELTDLKKQRKLLEPRISFTSDLHKTAEEQGLVEITEEFDEEKERKWRDQHRKNVQRYRKTLQDEQKVETTPDSQPLSDHDLWASLDELERVERERKELHRLTGDDEVRLTALADEQEKSEEEESSASQSNEESDEYEDSDESSDDTGDTTLNTKLITFTHTKTSEEESLPSETESIESPRDIYRKFCTPAEPKSILKSSNGSTQKVKKRVKLKEDIDKDSRRRAVRQQQQSFAGPVAFSGTVQEKQTPSLVTGGTPDIAVETMKSVTQQESQPKRISKFKAERQKKMAPT